MSHEAYKVRYNINSPILGSWGLGPERSKQLLLHGSGVHKASEGILLSSTAVYGVQGYTKVHVAAYSRRSQADRLHEVFEYVAFLSIPPHQLAFFNFLIP